MSTTDILGWIGAAITLIWYLFGIVWPNRERLTALPMFCVSQVLKMFDTGGSNAWDIKMQLTVKEAREDLVKNNALCMCHFFAALTALMFIDFNEYNWCQRFSMMLNCMSLMIIERFDFMHNTRAINVMATLICAWFNIRPFVEMGISEKARFHLILGGLVTKSMVNSAISTRMCLTLSALDIISFSLLNSLFMPLPELQGGGYIYWIVGMLLLNLLHEASLRQCCSASLLAEETSAANQSLLSSVCDEVIDLDEQLNVLTEAHKLESLLMRSGTSSLLRGTCITDLMGQGDKTAFKDFLVSSSNLPFQLHLRDASSQQVKFELYHTVLTGNTTCHRIGLRELDDWSQRGVTDLRECSNPAPKMEVQCETDASMSSACSRTSPSGASSFHASGELPATSCCINWSLASYRVYSRGNVHPAIRGTLIDSPEVLAWILKWLSFRSLVKDLLNLAIGCFPEDLNHPQRVKFELAFKASCRLPRNLDMQLFQPADSLAEGPDIFCQLTQVT